MLMLIPAMLMPLFRQRYAAFAALFDAFDADFRRFRCESPPPRVIPRERHTPCRRRHAHTCFIDKRATLMLLISMILMSRCRAATLMSCRYAMRCAIFC